MISKYCKSSCIAVILQECARTCSSHQCIVRLQFKTCARTCSSTIMHCGYCSRMCQRQCSSHGCIAVTIQECLPSDIAQVKTEHMSVILQECSQDFMSGQVVMSCRWCVDSFTDMCQIQCSDDSSCMCSYNSEKCARYHAQEKSIISSPAVTENKNSAKDYWGPMSSCQVAVTMSDNVPETMLKSSCIAVTVQE